MMFLTPEERVALTGKDTKQGQKKWLRLNKIPYRIRSDGWPVVARAAVLTVLAPNAQSGHDTEPNWDAVDAHVKAA